MILLDTHILLWASLAPQRLSSKAKKAIMEVQESGNLLIAGITLWEIAMLIEKGRVQVDAEPLTFLNLLVEGFALQIKLITPQIASISVNLPNAITKDPADRLILATAIAENAPLVTADKNLHAGNVVAAIW